MAQLPLTPDYGRLVTSMLTEQNQKLDKLCTILSQLLKENNRRIKDVKQSKETSREH